MLLTEKDGAYILRDQSQICNTIDCESLPADIYDEYIYTEKLIFPQDMRYCASTNYIYKDYGSYSLAMEVDIPVLTAGPHPFIIYVHGGGWSGGNTSVFENHSRYLASRGIAGIRITYSLTGQGGNFDKGMQELADAFVFIQEHADEWDLDMERFGYAAGSAGTPLAALKAMKQQGCKLFLGFYGIYDFQNNLNGDFGKTSSYFGNYTTTESRNVISAINYIPENNIPAVRLFHGTADYTLSYLQSSALNDSILKKGGDSQFFQYETYDHSFLNRGVADIYEEIIIKMYESAKNVFNMQEIIFPEESLNLLGEFKFTTGNDQAKAENVIEGLNIADITTGNLKSEFSEDAFHLSDWVSINVGANKYFGFKIMAESGYVYEMKKVDVEMKRSDNKANLIRISYGNDKPNTTQYLGAVITAGTDQYSVYSLEPGNTPATAETPYYAIGLSADSRETKVSLDRISIYGEISESTGMKEMKPNAYRDLFVLGKMIVVNTNKADLVQLYNISGALIKSVTVNGSGSQQLYVDKAGCYILKISGSKNIFQKIIIQ
jgi:acetyl esterase/lipase